MATEMPSCASVVLAAGGSSRLGAPKQLLRVGGESLVRRIVRLVIEAGCSPVVVVVGAYAEKITLELNDMEAILVENPQWGEGMGASIRCGMSALQDPWPEKVLLCVCDQPNINSDLLRALIAAQTGDRILAASQYNGTLGVPAVFSRSLFPQLQTLSGDRGARALIGHNADYVACVDFPGGEFDVDTAEDASRLSPIGSQ